MTYLKRRNTIEWHKYKNFAFIDLYFVCSNSVTLRRKTDALEPATVRGEHCVRIVFKQRPFFSPPCSVEWRNFTNSVSTFKLSALTIDDCETWLILSRHAPIPPSPRDLVVRQGNKIARDLQFDSNKPDSNFRLIILSVHSLDHGRTLGIAKLCDRRILPGEKKKGKKMASVVELSFC